MALDYRILAGKHKILFKNDFDGTEYVEAYDLLTGNFNYKLRSLSYPLVVTKDYIGRPDLISLAKYETDSYADIICKINGISNPFEMNEGDIIYLPDVNMLQYYVNSGANYSEVDDSIIENEEEPIRKRNNKFQKLKTEKRMPAESIIGDNNFYRKK